MRIVYREYGKRGRAWKQPKEIDGDYKTLARLILDPMVAQVWAEDEDGKMVRMK